MLFAYLCRYKTYKHEDNMIEMLKATEVFTPGSYPSHTYVEREDKRYEDRLRDAIDTPGQLLQYSQLGAWSKFAMIAAHAVFCAGICYTNDKQRLILGTILMLPPFGVAAAAYDQAGLLNIMNATLGLAWLSLLVMAIVSVVRAKGAQA